MPNETDLKDHDLLISLNTKVDSMLEKLEKLDGFDVRIREVELSNGISKTNMETLGKEVEKLRNTSGIWNSILTLLTVIAVALGITPK